MALLMAAMAVTLAPAAHAASAAVETQAVAMEASQPIPWDVWLWNFLLPLNKVLLRISENVAVTTLYVSISIIVLAILEGIINYVTGRISRTMPNPNAIKRIGTFQSLALSVARYAVGLAAAIYILVLWGIPPETLAVGTAVIGGAIGFGSQGFVQDMITGFSILFEDQIHVGDFVKIGDVTGTVEDVGLRVIKIRTSSGDLHTLFNRTVVAVTNLKPPEAPPEVKEAVAENAVVEAKKEAEEKDKEEKKEKA